MKKNRGGSISLKVMTLMTNLGLMSRTHPNQKKEEEDVTFETPAMGKEKGFSQNALMIVNNPMHLNKESTEDFAFRNGPRRDGIIRKKDGSLIIIDDPLYSETLQPTNGRPKEEGELPEQDSTPPRWSPLLMRIQRQKLKMKYKSRVKVRAKLMRSIRKRVPKQEHIRWEQPNSVITNKLRKLLSLSPYCLTLK